MSRSKWKGPFLSKELLVTSLKTPKIWSRSSSIPESLVGKSVLVYNGRSFVRVSIKRDRVGFKFGEFSFTRKVGGNKKKKKLRKT
jgi:small subunit ribosomal protein S19